MSVLRYPGGKTRALTHIIPHIPDDVIYLYSPFFGGGSVELTCVNSSKQQLVKSQLKEIRANDKFKPLVDFWKEAQSNKDRLVQLLTEWHPTVTKDSFMKYRYDILHEQSSLKRAAMYFVINRCSFSGSTFSGGYSKESKEKRFTPSSINRLKSLDLSKCVFSNLDYKDFFDTYTDELVKPGHFIYADPPYMLKGKSKLYGNNGDLHESFSHLDFKESICKYPQWIISYNDCPEIRNLYNDYHILPVTWAYGMGLSKASQSSNETTLDSKTKTVRIASNEILIINKPSVTANTEA